MNRNFLDWIIIFLVSSIGFFIVFNAKIKTEYNIFYEPRIIVPQTPKIPEEIHTCGKQAKWVNVRLTKYIKTGNPMANGEYPYVGAVAISDRSYKIGSLVLIFGQWYTVKDRTALWINDKYGLTIDIFTDETREEALKFGVKKTKVLIINQ